ncbi:MAG: rhombosortase [Spirochaetes bacterium]|nr:rhombosortase [Spirochaetota bacterium]
MPVTAKLYKSVLKPWIAAPLLISLICILLQCFPDSGAFLEYSRPVIESGEVWRIFTGHFVHWSWNHVFWDVMTFFVTGIIVYKSRALSFWLLIFVTCIAVSAGLLFLHPDLKAYRGISGIDLAFFSYAALFLIRCFYRKDRILSITGMIAFAAMIVKIIYETATGSAVFVNTSGYRLIPLSHAIGAAAGFAVWLFIDAGIAGDRAGAGKTG